MAFSLVICTYCTKSFYKDNRHVNENIKLGNNFYCSSDCQYSYKNKQIEFECENPACRNKFMRAPNNVSAHNYCSRSCSATVNNSKDPKRQKIEKICNFCKTTFTGKRKKFCSYSCQYQSYKVPAEEIIVQIRSFYKKWNRIPLKREFNHYSSARKWFGTWNKAIEAAGFEPNPVLFANNCIAKDGHICNSIAEKLIDDYLHKRGINHLRNSFYPKGGYIADFKIGNKIVEYFGLSGEHKEYDKIRKIKQNMAKRFNFQLIEIYPEDLYSKGGLDKILKPKLSHYTYGVEAKFY